MEHLFSPWRMKYMMDNDSDNGCIFCELPKKDNDRESLIVYRGENAYVLLNRFPYNSGHLMVAPYEHIHTIEILEPETRLELMDLVTKTVSVLKGIYTPDGFNIGANIGAAAGAGFAGHVHFHIVPRWVGDSNFMSTVGNTRVLPEDLSKTWERVHSAWDEHASG